MKSLMLKIFTAVLCLSLLIPGSAVTTGDTAHAAPGDGVPGGVANVGYEPWYYYIGDMVNAANGNLFFKTRDISVKARGFDIEIVRAYNSLLAGEEVASSSPGKGWTHNYNVSLFEDVSEDVEYVDSDGTIYNFTHTGGGNYTSPAGLYSKLLQYGDGTFDLYLADGERYNFNADGRLLNIYDRNNNSLGFSYDGSNRLVSIADDSGLSVNLTYNAGNRLSTVTDPLGRQIQYQYDASGNLVSVTDAMGNSTLYFYYTDSKLRSVVNRYGGMLSFIYQNGKVVEIDQSFYDKMMQIPTGSLPLYIIGYGSNNAVVTDSRGNRTIVGLNAAGNPVQIIDAMGYTTRMTWDADFNKTGYTDANGHSYNLTYNSYRNLVQEADPAGSSTQWFYDNIPGTIYYVPYTTTNARGYTTSFDYDSSGNLISVTDATGNSSHTSYNSYGFADNHTDPNGNVTYYTYDARGNRLTRTDALGNTSSYTYDVAGRLLSETDADGHTTSYQYDNNDRLTRITDALGKTTQYYYNKEGTLVKTIDTAGRTTQYSNTVLGTVDKVTDALGYKTESAYDANGNLLSTTSAAGGITNIKYDPLNRITSITDALGNTENFTYDAVGNRLSFTGKRGYTTTYTYDVLNRLTGETDALGNTETYSYDAVNNLVSETDAAGTSTVYQYDVLDRITQVTRNGVTLTEVTYDANSNILSMTGANGYATVYGYNAVNSMTSITDPTGNQTLFTYDARKNLVSETDRNGYTTNYNYDALNRLSTITDPLGHSTTFTYNSAGNLISETDALGNTIQTVYDALGRVTANIDANGAGSYTVYDQVGNIISRTDANSNTTTYQYDLLNRITRDTGPLGYQTNYEYDAEGNIVKITDASGNFTVYEYDALNRMTKAADALGGENSFTYDALGNLVIHTDANGDNLTYQYDAFSRLVKTVTALGKETRYSYDNNGNLVWKTDANGDNVTYTYDSLNRRTAINYPDATAVSYSYDAEGNVLEISGSAGLGETTNNTYDALGRILSTSVNYTSFSRTINYTYNAIGRQTLMEADGNSTSYSYDAAGRLVSLTDPSGTTTFTYDPAGRRTGKTLSNGAVTTYAYNDADWLLSITNRKSDTSVISSYTYTYDVMGNRVSMTEYGGNVTSYTYDELRRLTGATYPSAETVSYTYDAAGNRLSTVTGGGTDNYTYDADSRMLSAGGITYVYDDNGNLISKTDGGNVTAYQYDYENRLSTVTLPDTSTIAYQYAAYGDRLSRTESGNTTYYFYNVNDVVLEIDSSGDTRKWVSHGPGLDEPLYEDVSGEGESYYLFDGLGSVTALADDAQNISAVYSYDVFGGTTGETGALDNTYKFVARELDEDTGLYYMRNRYYDPYGGRFLSRDPWGTTIGDVYPYAYASNNPVNFVDPFGLQTIRHFNNKSYPLDEYDRSCLDEAYRRYSEAWDRVNEEINKIEKKLNNMLNKMRNQAKEKADTAFMHAAIGTFIGVAVGAAVGALTLNPVAGAVAGAAASRIYGIATSGGISGTDVAQDAVGTAASIAADFAGAVASTVNLYWSMHDIDESLQESLRGINDLARKLQQNFNDLCKRMYQEAKNLYDQYAQSACKKRKEPEEVVPPVTTGPVDTGYDSPGTVTVYPGVGEWGGGESTAGIDHTDVDVDAPGYLDPDIATIGINVTVKNRGFKAVDGLKLKVDVFEDTPPEDKNILLVIDESDGADWYYRQALTANGYTFDDVEVDVEYTPVYADADPDTKDLKDYDVVIWECSNDRDGTLDPPAQDEIELYLDNGGCFMLAGEGIIYDWPAREGTLMSDYLFADGYGTDTMDMSVDGVYGTIGEGLAPNLSGGSGSGFEVYSSSIAGVIKIAEICFLYDDGIAGLQMDTGKYKAVYLSFNFDSIALESERNELMKNIMDFLDCRYRHPEGDGGHPPEDVPSCDPGTPGIPVTPQIDIGPGGHIVVIGIDPGDTNISNDTATTTVYRKSDEDPMTTTVDDPGWTHEDWTQQCEHWQASTYNAYSGGNSWWCGVNDPYYGIGYGPNWVQYLNIPVITMSPGAYPVVTFWYRTDNTQMGDYCIVEYWCPINLAWYEWEFLPATSGTWQQYWTEFPDRSGPEYSGLNTLDFRFRFQSGPTGSDFGGAFTPGGAFHLDEITVYDSNNGGPDLYYNTCGDAPGSEIGTSPVPATPPGSGDLWGVRTYTGSGLAPLDAGPQSLDPGLVWACVDPDTGNWTDNMSNALISPSMNITGFTNPQLVYDAYINLPPANNDIIGLYVSTDNGTTYNWLANIGSINGITSPPFSVSQYKSPTFKVMFLAVSQDGNHTEGMYIGDISVIEGVPLQPPVADFTYSPLEPELSDNITFDASLSMDYDGTIVAYRWYFGDGTTANTSVASHKYSTPWMYPVTLEVTDSDNLTGGITKNILVPLHYPAGQGDANVDGFINVGDMTWVAKIILMLEEFNTYADANSDGNVNVLDMTKIAKMILGLD